MSRLSDSNIALAREIISRYPRKKSALIPLLHLSQEQNGYVTDEAMRHLAGLLELGDGPLAEVVDRDRRFVGLGPLVRFDAADHVLLCELDPSGARWTYEGLNGAGFYVRRNSHQGLITIV